MPELMKQLPDLDAETLFTVLQKEFPDLPEAICQRIVPRMLEIDPQKLPWNRRLRRKMMKSKRLIVHLFAGPDEKKWNNWKALEDADMVCVDKVLHPQSDVLNDRLMMFLLQLATMGTVQAIIVVHLADLFRPVAMLMMKRHEAPKPVRSEQEPYGLLVEDDFAMLFRMKLLYMVAEHYKPKWCKNVIFAVEQPQDPKEYRPQQDIEKHQYMSVWRMAAWKSFQDKYGLTSTSFEQGAFGHLKPSLQLLLTILRALRIGRCKSCAP